MGGEAVNKELKPLQYSWLVNEIGEVKTPKFFDIDGPALSVYRNAFETTKFPIPPSYEAFVSQFGSAKLYKQHAGYALKVRATPIEAISKSGKRLLCFGYYQGYQACFKIEHLGDGKESAVFESRENGRLIRIADDFTKWLKIRSDVIHKEIGRKRWAEIVRGPTPFTLKEKEIVEGRGLYSWQIVGIAHNDDIIFKVHNGSNVILPYYSIGIRDKVGELSGKIWLPVAQIKPGATHL